MVNGKFFGSATIQAVIVTLKEGFNILNGKRAFTAEFSGFAVSVTDSCKETSSWAGAILLYSLVVGFCSVIALVLSLSSPLAFWCSVNLPPVLILAVGAMRAKAVSLGRIAMELNMRLCGLAGGAILKRCFTLKAKFSQVAMKHGFWLHGVAMKTFAGLGSTSLARVAVTIFPVLVLVKLTKRLFDLALATDFHDVLQKIKARFVLLPESCHAIKRHKTRRINYISFGLSGKLLDCVTGLVYHRTNVLAKVNICE